MTNRNKTGFWGGVKRRIGVWGLLFLGLIPARAQEEMSQHRLRLSWDLLPFAHIDNPAAATPEELRLRRGQALWAFPHTHWKEGLITSQMGYGFTRLQAREMPVLDAGDAPLHFFMGKTSWRKPLSDAWAMNTTLGLSLNSDMKDITFDDVKAEGGVGFLYLGWSPFLVGAAATYTYEFGRPRVVPAPVLMYRKKGDRFQLSLLPPFHVDASYAVKPQWLLGLSAGPAGRRYALEDQNGYDKLTLDLVEFDLGPYVKFLSDKGYFFKGQIGAASYRKVVLRNAHNEISALDLKSGPWMRLEAGWGFKL